MPILSGVLGRLLGLRLWFRCFRHNGLRGRQEYHAKKDGPSRFKRQFHGVRPLEESPGWIGSRLVRLPPWTAAIKNRRPAVCTRPPSRGVYNPPHGPGCRSDRPCPGSGRRGRSWWADTCRRRHRAHPWPRCRCSRGRSRRCSGRGGKKMAPAGRCGGLTPGVGDITIAG